LKRYLFSIVFAVFAVGGIAVSYIYSAIDHLPKYRLAAVQGNPEEGRAVELLGSYYGSVYSYALNVNEIGSSYSQYTQTNFRHNILNTRPWFFRYSDIRQLVKEHRPFMRNRSNSNGFYSDEERLIYADTARTYNEASKSTITILSISILDKATKQTREYELNIEEPHNILLRDVQFTDDRIHLLMSVYPSDRMSSDSIYHYAVGLSDGELKSVEKLEQLALNSDDEHIYRAYAIADSTSSAPNDFVIFLQYEEKITSVNGVDSYRSERISERFYAYSYRTGELSALPIKSGDRGVGSLDGNVFAYAVKQDEEIMLSSYDLNTGVLNEAAITASDMGATEIGNSMSIANNRLYVLITKDRVPMAAVVDIHNGELLYAGEAVYVGPDSEAEYRMGRLHLLNLKVKE